MPRFRVIFKETTVTTSFIDLDAPDEEQAEEMALQQHPDGAVALEPDDGSFEVDYVEKLED